MDNRLLAEGMLLGISSMGVIIDKWDENTLYISVPRWSTDYGPDGKSLAGKALADRLQTKFRDMGAKDFKVKFRIRDETWTKEKRDQILK